MPDPPDGLDHSRHAPFRTTLWGLVLKARDADADSTRDALAALCEAYWFPLYAFVRRKGHSPDEAEDIVQGFFALLLERDDIRSVDPSKGKFRSFLMAACSNYLSNLRDHARALKRGGGRPLVRIDRHDAEARYRREPSHELTAERLFERRWAVALLDRVIERLAEEMTEPPRRTLFERLRPLLTAGRGASPYAVIADELGMSEGAVKMAALRLRKRYREILREEIAATLSDPAEIEQEIQDLFTALGR